MKILQNFPGLMFPWNIEAGPMLVFLSAAHFCRSLNRGQLIMLGIVNIQQLLLPLTCFLPVVAVAVYSQTGKTLMSCFPLSRHLYSWV